MSSDKSLLIVMLVNRLDATGGAEKQALLLAEELLSMGHQVRLLTSTRRRNRDASPLRVPPGARLVSFPHVLLPAPSRGFSLAALMFLNVCLNHRRHRTVLHAHSLNVSGFAAASATAALNLPSLVKLASSGQEGDVTRLRRSFGSGVRVRILVKNADFAVLNKQAEQELTSLGVDPRRIHHVQNAVRPVAETRSGIAKSQARRRLGLPSDALVLLFAGRLVPKKEVRTLLKALQLLGASDQRHVHLAVAGDGPLRPDLEQHAAELDVRARLTFLGHLADIDVAFHAADLLVLPSHSEGMPNVLLESMAAGLPFVCADVPGSGDLARRCRLPLAACSTPAALAEAIREGLLLADDREVSNRLRTTATHVYSPKAVAERYVEIYQELLRRSSA